MKTARVTSDLCKINLIKGNRKNQGSLMPMTSPDGRRTHWRAPVGLCWLKCEASKSSIVVSPSRIATVTDTTPWLVARFYQIFARRQSDSGRVLIKRATPIVDVLHEFSIRVINVVRRMSWKARFTWIHVLEGRVNHELFFALVEIDPWLRQIRPYSVIYDQGGWLAQPANPASRASRERFLKQFICLSI